MRYVVYDIETRSAVSLKQVGSHVYACDPTTDVWCVSYCVVVDGERSPITTWLPSDPVPQYILAAAADPDTLIVAFNDAFERQIEEHILHPRYGWPLFPLERRRCAQAIALTHTLPGSLDAVAAALKLNVRKAGVGKRAMKLLAQPRKPHKDEDPTQVYWRDESERLAILYEYNRIDVEITAEIVKRLGFIPPQEQAVWQLDAIVNRRGIHINVPLLDAALDIAKQADVELHEKFALLTDGEITGPAQTQRILKWLAQRGCAIADVQGGTLAETLKRSDLVPEVRQLIGLRLDGAHAAVNKLTTLRRWIGDDHRIRQVYRYHGAMPGRFTSHGAQMQNLKKPMIENVGAAIDAVSIGSLPHMQERYERPLAVVGDITRAMVTAAPGHRLFIADLSGIESRGLAWLTNETNKLDQWRKFDRTGNPEDEPYFITGHETFGLPKEKARKRGKTGDLAYGYQGSLGAWRRLAPVDDTTPDATVHENRRKWVLRHPNIARFWIASVRQAVNAIENGERFTVARIAFQREGEFLHLELPSSRRIHYPFARTYADERNKTFTFRDASGGRWEWYHILKGGRGVFGGLIAENATQALCRDIFVDAMLRLESRGYAVTAHLHDEFVCEVSNDFGNLDEFLSIITTPPAWAPDFPVAAKGRIADRFIEIKEATPITAIDLDAINIGLRREGIEPIPPTDCPEITHHEPAYAVASETPATPDVKFPLPPPDIADDLPPRGNGHAGNGFDSYAAGEERTGNPLERYVYTNEQGELHQRKTRSSTKKFWQETWEGDRWIKGAPKIKYLYGIRELLAAPLDTAVWIAEGEKDKNTLTTLDLLAVTNPGGAGKWHSDFTPEQIEHWFKGRQTVYVLEDNDPPGRKHVEIVGHALYPLVADVRIVSFRELPEKSDVTDWMELGHTKAELLARAAASPVYQPPALQSVCAADVTMTAVVRLWPNRFGLGKLGIIAGLPDEGKGLLISYIAAQTTNGGTWPCNEGIARRGKVILFTAEDDPSDTVVPRLAATGADLTCIVIISMVREAGRDRMFSLHTDLDTLRRKIDEVGDVVLVLIDPIPAYLGVGKMDSYRTTDVRAVLGPVVNLAAGLKLAVIGIMHFNKKVDITNALLRISDSLAYGATARHVYGVINDAENKRKLIVRAKNNLAENTAEQTTLAFSFGVREVGTDPDSCKTIVAPYVIFEPDYVEVSATEAMQAASESKSPTERQDAKQFVLDMLAGGPVKRSEIDDTAKANGISLRTLERAKRELKNVVARPEKNEKGVTEYWVWELLPEKQT